MYTYFIILKESLFKYFLNIFYENVNNNIIKLINFVLFLYGHESYDDHFLLWQLKIYCAII